MPTVGMSFISMLTLSTVVYINVSKISKEGDDLIQDQFLLILPNVSLVSR
jgi:hypothetical protein